MPSNHAFKSLVTVLLINIIIAHPYICAGSTKTSTPHPERSTLQGAESKGSVKSFASARSIALQPMLDGNADNETREIALTLGSALRVSTPHHVVDSDIVSRVLSYEDNKKAGDASLSDAANSIARAKEYAFKFQYRDAELLLNQAIESLKGKTLNEESGPMLLDAYLTRAVVAKAKGDKKAAGSAFAAALAINPGLTLAESEYPPSLVAIFDEEQKTVKNSPAGSLTVKSDPAAADVLINGIRAGVSPLEINSLPAGRYTLQVATNKYDVRSQIVEIQANKETKIKEKLRWAKDRAKNTSKIDNAEAEINEGVRVGEALKVDRVILINADAGQNGALKITARTVDRALRAGERPVVIPKLLPETRNEKLAELTSELANQISRDLLANPGKSVDPKSQGDPVLLSKNKKNLTKRPVFWVLIGTLAAGAVVGGILAAFSSHSNNAATGSVNVQFK